MVAQGAGPAAIAEILQDTLPERPADRVSDPVPMAGAAEWCELAAALVAADPGPQVTIATAQRWVAEAAADAYEAGWNDGRLDLIADEKSAQVGIARVLRESATPALRWHVCCGPCRRGGHRPGCPRCEDRTRETFGRPHPDDFPGLDGAA
jgi:hypothetical protein